MTKSNAWERELSIVFITFSLLPLNSRSGFLSFYHFVVDLLNWGVCFCLLEATRLGGFGWFAFIAWKFIWGSEILFDPFVFSGSGAKYCFFRWVWCGCAVLSTWFLFLQRMVEICCLLLIMRESQGKMTFFVLFCCLWWGKCFVFSAMYTKEISLLRISFFILHPAFSHPPNKIWRYRFFCPLFANCSECLIKARFFLVIIISICDQKCIYFDFANCWECLS